MVPSFATLTNTKMVMQSPRPQYMIVEKHFFQAALRGQIEKIPFDEKFYLAKYPDIAEAIAKRVVPDARQHYLAHGYFENRLPHPVKVDAKWYLKEYPDVREAVRREEVASAQEHFETVGFAEGRFPYANFVLAS
jgi:hypothetical protein